MTHVGRARVFVPEDREARDAAGTARSISGGWAEALAAHGAGIARARQTVTPKLRRFVIERDGGRCVVPGCRNTRFLEVHHLTFRSRGGTNEAENLGVLCSTHHAWVHRGRIRIEGTPSSGLRFFHADGSAYGARPASGARRAPDARTDEAAAALRSLGFDPRVVRALIVEAERELPAGAGAGEIVERAIRRAGRRRAGAAAGELVADRLRVVRGDYAWASEAIARSASWLRAAA